ALSAIIFGNIIHLIAFIMVWTSYFSTVISPLIYAYILLWIVLSILGYLFKIVPFLWWTHKYSSEIGKKSVPTLKQMMNEKAATPLFSLYILSVIIVFFALTFKIALLFNIGQFILSIVFITMMITILSVLKK
ncbi:MAG TPA: hypothetical protein VJ546_00595, partial [Bacillales bacterium]|nr:hypothetical protein [Bacillales bacterium]